jgi:hypothetical protein
MILYYYFTMPKNPTTITHRGGDPTVQEKNDNR